MEREAMPELTRNEEFVLLCIWKLKQDAYGVTVREQFRNITGKTLNYGSLYNTLYSLVRKGLVRAMESEPLAVKGGRRKILYSLTQDGNKALRDAQQIQRQAWQDVPDLVVEGKK
jgi:DNA-binding PadR family transcriptional regulator